VKIHLEMLFVVVRCWKTSHSDVRGYSGRYCLFVNITQYWL